MCKLPTASLYMAGFYADILSCRRDGKSKTKEAAHEARKQRKEERQELREARGKGVSMYCF